MVLPLVLSLAALAAPDAADPADPLAAARQGMLQCYAPDPARRTCRSLSAYVFGPDGVENRAEVLISPDGPLVMKASTSVRVQGGAVCGPIRAQDIDASEVLFAGRPLGGARAEHAKAELKRGLAALIGAEVCTTFTPTAQGYVTHVTVDGQPAAEMSDSPLMWVKPDDGWRVAP